MSIRIYNTLSKAKEPLETIVHGQVGMYLCGPTVYKPSHIGHMVGPVIFDTVKRYLTYCGYRVTFVINITDVDDKLINESRARGMEMSALAKEMTADYMANLATMGVDSVDVFPRATEHMDEIIRFTQDLVDRGYAYQAEGDVYFDVAKDPGYGKLSHRKLEHVLGEGGDMADRKRSSFDFALWKSAKPGEPSWDSPWGKGRPGWHIECSAMSRGILGETFDIHGGGLDLVFPHHENEIAQSECCHGKPQARYWMHNGLMQASNEVGKLGGRNTQTLDAGDQQAQEAGKIGKSKGASAFSELLKSFPAETIRFFLLATHYRSPIDYSEQRLREVDSGLATFYRFFERYQRVAGQSYYELAAQTTRAGGDAVSSVGELSAAMKVHREKFLKSMDDDFNTGAAIAELFDMVRTLNRFVDAQKLEEARASADGSSVALKEFTSGAEVLRELCLTLGLFRTPPEQPKGGNDELVGKLMSLLIEVRADARKAKNFAAADKIRKSLVEIGIALEDRADGTQWTIERR